MKFLIVVVICLIVTGCMVDPYKCSKASPCSKIPKPCVVDVEVRRGSEQRGEGEKGCMTQYELDTFMDTLNRGW